MWLKKRTELTYCNIKTSTEKFEFPHFLVGGEAFTEISWQFEKLFFKDKSYENTKTKKKEEYKEFNMILIDGGNKYCVQWSMFSGLTRSIVQSLISEVNIWHLRVALYTNKSWYASAWIEHNGESMSWGISIDEMNSYVDKWMNQKGEEINIYPRLIDELIKRAGLIQDWLPWAPKQSDPTPTQEHTLDSDDDDNNDLLQSIQDSEAEIERGPKQPRDLKDDEWATDKQITLAGRTWKDKVKAMKWNYKIDDYCKETYWYNFMYLSKSEIGKLIDLLLNTKSWELETVLIRTLSNPNDDQAFGDGPSITSIVDHVHKKLKEEAFDDLPF